MRISDWSSDVCSSDLPWQAAPPPRTVRVYVARTAASLPVRTIGEPEGVELAYETVDWRPAESGRITDAIYEEYGLQAIRIPGAQAHPTKLVQSVAMAYVAPPTPSNRPRLPANIFTHRIPSASHPSTVTYPDTAHSDSPRRPCTHHYTR